MTTRNCSKCRESKPFSEFNSCKSKKSGFQSFCKVCSKTNNKNWYKINKEKKLEYGRNRYHEYIDYERNRSSSYFKQNLEKNRAKRAARRALEKQAIPLWFEKDKVALVYKKAQEWGFEVDHIIPLQGELVCGLHCWANLQLLDITLNRKKHNREYPDH
jgi:hypothetical protein